MAELPIVQPQSVASEGDAFDIWSADGIPFEEEFFHGGLDESDVEPVPITKAQATANLAENEAGGNKPAVCSNTAMSHTTPPRNEPRATPSPTRSSTSSSFQRLLASAGAAADAVPSPLRNRKRVRGKSPAEGYYISKHNTHWRKLKTCRDDQVDIQFGLDTWESFDRPRKEAMKLYDRVRKILSRHIKPSGVSSTSGVSAKNKEARRKLFSAFSLKEKQEHYEAVVRGEKLSPEDMDALLEFGGFTGFAGRGKCTRHARAGYPINKNIQSKALFNTYHSEKLQLKCAGLADLNEKDLIRRVRSQPEVIQLIDDLPKAIQSQAKRLKVDKNSWSLEICMKTYEEKYKETEKVRLHIHTCLQRDLPFTGRHLAADLKLGGLLPSHIAGANDPVTGKKAKSTSAMHYYNQMPKLGRLAGGSNYKPFADFIVNPRWIAGYVQRQKMSIEDAKKESVFFLVV